MTQSTEMVPTESQKKAVKAYEDRFKDKGRMITFRLSNDELERLDNKALEAGLNRTELLKRWINE